MEETTKIPGDFLSTSLEECLRFDGGGFRKKKRSSILKQTKNLNTDTGENDDTEVRRSTQNYKRVSFAETFQVMELHTGNIYDIPGQNESSKECISSSQISSFGVDRENVGCIPYIEKSSFGVDKENIRLGMGERPCTAIENFRLEMKETVHERKSCSTSMKPLENSFYSHPLYAKEEHALEINESVKYLLDNSTADNDMSITSVLSSTHIEKENYTYQTHHSSTEQTIYSVSHSYKHIIPEKPGVSSDIDFDNMLIQEKENLRVKSPLYDIKSSKMGKELIAGPNPSCTSLDIFMSRLSENDTSNSQSNKENIHRFLPKCLNSNQEFQASKENIFGSSFLKCRVDNSQEAHMGEEKMGEEMDESINISKSQHLTSNRQNIETGTSHIRNMLNANKTDLPLLDMDETCAGPLKKYDRYELPLFPPHMQEWIHTNSESTQDTGVARERRIDDTNYKLSHNNPCNPGGKMSRSFNKTKLTDMDITCMPDNIVEGDLSEVNIDQSIMNETGVANSDNFYRRDQPSTLHFVNKEVDISKAVEKKTYRKSLTLGDMDITCLPDNVEDSSELYIHQDDSMNEIKAVENHGFYGKQKISSAHLVDKKCSTSRDFYVKHGAVEKKSYRKSLTLGDMDITCVPDSAVEDECSEVNVYQDDMNETELVKNKSVYGKHQISAVHFADKKCSRDFQPMDKAIEKKSSRKSLTLGDMDITCMPDNVVEGDLSVYQDDMEETELFKSKTLYGKHQISASQFDDDKGSRGLRPMHKAVEKKSNRKSLTLGDMDITCVPDIVVEDELSEVNVYQDHVNETEPVKNKSLYRKYPTSATHFDDEKVSVSTDFHPMHNVVEKKSYRKSLTLGDMDITCMPDDVVEDDLSEINAHHDEMNSTNSLKRDNLHISHPNSIAHSVNQRSNTESSNLDLINTEHKFSGKRRSKLENNSSPIKTTDTTAPFPGYSVNSGMYTFPTKKYSQVDGIKSVDEKKNILRNTPGGSVMFQTNKIKISNDSQQDIFTIKTNNGENQSRCKSPIDEEYPQNQKSGPSYRKFMKITSEFGSPHKRLESLPSGSKSKDPRLSVKSANEENICEGRKRNLNPEIPFFLLKDSISKANHESENLVQTRFMDLPFKRTESLSNSEYSSVFEPEKTKNEDLLLCVPEATKKQSGSSTSDTALTVSNLCSSKTGIFSLNFLNLPSISDVPENDCYSNDPITSNFQSVHMEMTCAITPDGKHQPDNYSNSVTISTKENNHKSGVSKMSLSANEVDENVYSSNKTHLGNRHAQYSMSDKMDMTCKSGYLKDKPITNDSNFSILGAKTFDFNNMELTCAVSNKSLSDQTSILDINEQVSLNSSSLSNENIPHRKDDNLIMSQITQNNLHCVTSKTQLKNETKYQISSGSQNCNLKVNELESSYERSLTSISQDGKFNDKASVKRNIHTCEVEETDTFAVKRSKLATPDVIYKVRKFKHTIPGINENIYFSPELKDILKRKQSFGYKQPFSEMKMVAPVNYSFKKSSSFSSFARESSFTEQQKQDISSNKSCNTSCKAIKDGPVEADEEYISGENKDILTRITPKSLCFSDKDSHDNPELNLKSKSFVNKSTEDNVNESCKEINQRESPLKSTRNTTKSFSLSEKMYADDSKLDSLKVPYPYCESMLNENDSLQLLPNSLLNDSSTLNSMLINPKDVSKSVAKDYNRLPNLGSVQIDYSRNSCHPELTSERTAHALEPVNTIASKSFKESTPPRGNVNLPSLSTKQSLPMTDLNTEIASEQSCTLEILQKKLKSIGNDSVFESTPENHLPNLALEDQISKSLEVSKSGYTLHQDQNEEKQVAVDLPVKDVCVIVADDTELVPDLDSNKQMEAETFCCHSELPVVEKVCELESLSLASNVANKERDQPVVKESIPESSANQLVQTSEFDTKAVSVQSDVVENLQAKLSMGHPSPCKQAVEPLNMTSNEECNMEKQSMINSSVKQPVQFDEIETKAVSIPSNSIGSLQKNPSIKNSSLSEHVVEANSGRNNEGDQPQEIEKLQSSFKRQHVQLTDFDSEIPSVRTEAVENFPKRSKVVEVFNVIKEFVCPPNPKPKPLKPASNNADMSLVQGSDKVLETIHSASDKEEEINVRLSQMNVGSNACASANEANSLPKPLNLHLLKEQIEQASSGKESRWTLKTLHEKNAVFQLKWGPWLYKCIMLVYVDQINPKESKVSFGTTYRGNDELELIGYNCFKYLVQEEVVPFQVCSEKLITKIKEYSSVAKNVETLMRDIFHITIGNDYTVSETLNPLKITVELLNENLVSKFSLTFNVNLRTYPCEKIIPNVKHLMYKDIKSQVQDATASVEPGNNYLWNMAKKAAQL